MLISIATSNSFTAFRLAGHRHAPVAAFGRLPIDRWAILLAMVCLLAIAACARAEVEQVLEEPELGEPSALSRAWEAWSSEDLAAAEDPDAAQPPLPELSAVPARARFAVRRQDNLEAPAQPIGKLGLNIRPSEGELPTNVSEKVFADQPTAVDGTRHFSPSDYAWEAPAVHHGPLYFEEVNLERYGYSRGILQPAVSAAHFFTRVPALPYLVSAQPPRECIYTLGHYRPGDCVPRQIHWPPLCTWAGFVEGGVVTGLVFLIP